MKHKFLIFYSAIKIIVHNQLSTHFISFSNFIVIRRSMDLAINISQLLHTFTSGQHHLKKE
jgi:hypothetical protein